MNVLGDRGYVRGDFYTPSRTPTREHMNTFLVVLRRIQNVEQVNGGEEKDPTPEPSLAENSNINYDKTAVECPG